MNAKLPFQDRRDAGRQLGEAILGLRLVDPIVLALPRGGVPVGFEVARRLDAPLDILIVRKIGAPGHEEFGIGAVVDGSAPIRVIDEQAARATRADSSYIEQETARQLAEIERRRKAYGTGAPLSLKGRAVVVVDDGIATGGSIEAALAGLAEAAVGSVVLAVPVAPADTLSRLQGRCDAIVCLASPEPFYSVGRFYRDFTQTQDAEVIALLAEARAHAAKRTSPA